MQIGGIQNFQLPSLASINNVPKENLVTPSKPKKHIMVVSGGAYHNPTPKEILANIIKLQKSMKENFKNVEKLEWETYTVYSLNGETSEMRVAKSLMDLDERNFPTIDVKL